MKKKKTKDQKRCIALVKQARRSGWTLEDMAARLDVSFSSVSRWENGVCTPPRNTSARMVPMLEELISA